MPRAQDLLHPEAPPFVEAPGPQNFEKAGPINRVKSFAEVDFEHEGGRLSRMAASEKVSRVYDVLRDTSTGEEPSLVGVNEGVNSSLKPGGKNFSDSFHDAILEGDGPKLGWMNNSVYFGKEHQEGMVDSCEVNRAVEERRENLEDVLGDGRPESVEESRAEPVRTRAGLLIHGEESSFNLFQSERGGEPLRQDAAGRVKRRDVKAPSRGGDGPKKARVVGLKDRGFAMVIGGVHPANREQQDGVATKPAGSRGMEKLSVLVPFQGIPNLGSSLPVQGVFFDRQVQGIHSKRAEEFLGVCQEAAFLKQVYQLDEDPTVLFPLGTERDTASPLFTFGSTEPKTGDQSGRRIHPVGGVPSSNNTRAKAQVEGYIAILTRRSCISTN